MALQAICCSKRKKPGMFSYWSDGEVPAIIPKSVIQRHVYPDSFLWKNYLRVNGAFGEREGVRMVVRSIFSRNGFAGFRKKTIFKRNSSPDGSYPTNDRNSFFHFSPGVWIVKKPENSFFRVSGNFKMFINKNRIMLTSYPIMSPTPQHSAPLSLLCIDDDTAFWICSPPL